MAKVKRYVPILVAAERVTRDLMKLKEKYNRVIVEIGINKYNEMIQPEIDADLRAMDYALNRGRSNANDSNS